MSAQPDDDLPAISAETSTPEELAGCISFLLSRIVTALGDATPDGTVRIEIRGLMDRLDVMARENKLLKAENDLLQSMFNLTGKQLDGAQARIKELEGQ